MNFSIRDSMDINGNHMTVITRDGQDVCAIALNPVRFSGNGLRPLQQTIRCRAGLFRIGFLHDGSPAWATQVQGD